MVTLILPTPATQHKLIESIKAQTWFYKMANPKLDNIGITTSPVLLTYVPIGSPSESDDVILKSAGWSPKTTVDTGNSQEDCH